MQTQNILECTWRSIYFVTCYNGFGYVSIFGPPGLPAIPDASGLVYRPAGRLKLIVGGLRATG